MSRMTAPAPRRELLLALLVVLLRRLVLPRLLRLLLLPLRVTRRPFFPTVAAAPVTPSACCSCFVRLEVVFLLLKPVSAEAGGLI